MSASPHQFLRAVPATLPYWRQLLHSRSPPYIRPPPLIARSPSNRLFAFATGAAAAAAAAAILTPTEVYADLASAPSFHPSPRAAPIPVLPASPHAALLAGVASADLQAIQNLSALANDADAHNALLRAGAAAALAAALAAIDNQGNDAATDALRVNVVRVLADLARSREAHVAFADGGVLRMLTALLQRYPPVVGGGQGWWSWLRRGDWLPWGGESGEDTEKKGERKDAERGGMGDFMNLSLAGEALPPVDLAAGITYHTVRCLSNLARNSATHEDLLAAGVLSLLAGALLRTDASFANDVAADHESTETVRCTILTVAALAKSAPAEVVSRGGHKRLLHFMAKSQDPVAQMYAAGGVRNLARHPEESGKKAWQVHRELVVAGAADALAAGMAAKANSQTQVFSALAFADLMTTGHHKADIIRRWLEPAFSSFAALLREKNAGVSRAVYRALTALFGGAEQVKSDGNAATVVPLSLAKAIAGECGQLVNGAVTRGELVALKAVRAMCGDHIVARGMVDKGLLETLVRGARQGKGEYWEESVAALSLLAGWEEFVPLMISTGALRTVLQRPCLDHDARWAAAFVANMSRSQEYHAEIAHGALNLLLMALSSKDENAKREGARAFYNLSLGGVSRVMISQSPALTSLVRTAGSSKAEARRYVIGALARVSEAYEHATKLIEADVIRILLEGAKEDPRVTKDVALCIGHLSQVIEVHGSLARSGAAAWLVDMVSKNGGRGEDAADVMAYAVLGICNLAYSAGITRTTLRESGAVSILTAVSSGMSAPQVTYAARQALVNLRGNDKRGMLPVEAGVKPVSPA